MDQIQLTVSPKILHTVDPRLFGQFMERPFGREMGPGAALLPGTHELDPRAVKLMKELGATIIRFPAGTSIDCTDWRDMIDNVPGREGRRPTKVAKDGRAICNDFGYDEFLRLCGDLKAQPLLVLNLGDTLGSKTPKEAAMRVAGLVAYCNAPLGAKLPEDMPDWPAVRAKTGHKEPYGVKHWQIGNETSAILPGVQAALNGNRDAIERRCADGIIQIVQAMQAVDPDVKVMFDAQGMGNVPKMVHEKVGNAVSHVVAHYYWPWAMDKATRGKEEIPLDKLSASDIWYAFVSMPDMDDNGQSILSPSSGAISLARKEGWKVAVTEWCWNGWFAGPLRGKLAEPQMAKALGAAGILHALIRASDVVEVACHSIMVGNCWNIAQVRVDPNAKVEPYITPDGQLSSLYAKYHGRRLLQTELSGSPMFSQELAMGAIEPRKKVSYVDALVTQGDDGCLYVHAINRHMDKDITLTVDLSQLGGVCGPATMHVLHGPVENAKDAATGAITDTAVCLEGKTLKLTLPARSVSCTEVRAAGQKDEGKSQK
jgi:alpha-N-arabinofuranosidase